MSRLTSLLACGLTGLLAVLGGLGLDVAHAQAPVESDSIAQPLTGAGGAAGDAARGRAIVTNRQVGLCLLCHTGPFPEERSQGNLAPSLAGAGSRWSEGQLRLRVSDARRLNPASIMPVYHPARLAPDLAARVAPAFQGRPILDAQQIEDVVAFLSTLRE
jgi:L-cysteine S-thiosulfotransferase